MSAQPMVRPPASQHLVLLRMTPEAASANAAAVKNVFQLIAKATNGAVSVETRNEGAVAVTVLALPPKAPYRRRSVTLVRPAANG